MTENPVDVLAHHVAGTTYEDLPAAAVTAAKTFILDTLACGLAGFAGPDAGVVQTTARGWSARPEARIWGDARPLGAADAALVNAFHIHCLEFDCVHEGGVLHPMTALLPAAMAEAERQRAAGRPVSGRELITAVIVGADVACALACAPRAPLRFFRSATLGSLAAACASARMRGFDADRTAAALGIAYAQMAGTLQPHIEGSSMLALQVACGARNGLLATDLAANGLRGVRDMITGPAGYLRVFEHEGAFDPAWSSLGRTWRVCELVHKPFPSGRLTHYAVAALQDMQRSIGFTAADVTAIVCRVPPLPYELVGRPDVPSPTATYAKLCLAFVCATAVLNGTILPAHFAPAALTDPRVHALAEKVQVERDSNPDGAAFGPQTVEVHLRDGSLHTRTVDHALGDPRNPLVGGALDAKLAWCWGQAVALPAPPAMVAAAIDRLEGSPDATAILDLLTPGMSDR